VLPTERVAFNLAIGNFKKKMDEISPLSKFVMFIHFLHFGEDTTFVAGIICGAIWGSFPVLGPVS